VVTHDGYLVQPAVAVPEDAIDVTINQSGEVLAKLQGQVDLQNVGQLQLAIFPNEAGLEAIGGNLFRETAGSSGAPVIGQPLAPGFGSVLQGFLETSNVNAVEEITNLISAQRAYEMNSKVIQAADEMLATISNVR
jgi:flagellar basal-body rod protein FlgG